MKKIINCIIAFVCLIALFASCNKDTKWEYKTIKIKGGTEYQYPEANPLTFETPDDELNQMGEEGWELVTAYPEIETKFPNFGNKEYVTGLQSNTRTTAIVFVFKRNLAFKTDSIK